jgi:anti-sigma regulatory factor (Ser/Thr protein kinase)
MVVVSELVTNAVRHGGGCVELTVRRDDGRVLVVAADRSPGLPQPSIPQDGGRGIMLIEAPAGR